MTGAWRGGGGGATEERQSLRGGHRDCVKYQQVCKTSCQDDLEFMHDPDHATMQQHCLRSHDGCIGFKASCHINVTVGPCNIVLW